MTTDTEDDWQPTELEYLRSDVRALRHLLERVRTDVQEALRLCKENKSPTDALERALHPRLGENTTGYALRASPETEERWFESWREREDEIARLTAVGVRTIELAELPARSCMVTPWYKPRRVNAKGARAKRANVDRR